MARSVYISPAGTICDAVEAFGGGGALKPGYRLQMAANFMDGRPNPAALFHDGKADEPKTIDEALRWTFKSEANKQGFKTTAEYLTQLKPDKLEEIAAHVATKFVALVGGAGVAAKFADAACIPLQARTEAWRQHNAAMRDVRKAEVSTAYLGGGDRGHDPAAEAVRDAASAARYFPQADPKAAYEAAVSSEKARIGDAWRAPDDGRSIRDAARFAAYTQD